MAASMAASMALYFCKEESTSWICAQILLEALPVLTQKDSLKARCLAG